ncbi:MAG: sigma-70 family RNA polymerase sigma factor [Clostridiales bacterium]|nr:sigma-70 family RNA polymerase sigma factor [Clostridiales bacterium]
MTEQKRLLIRYTEGDVQAMNELIEAYKQDLYNLCFRLTFSLSDADDLFQQTWLKVINRPEKFNGNSFKNWLYTVCVNTFRDGYRKRMRLMKIGGVEFKNNQAKDIAMALVSDNVTTEDIAQGNFIKTTLVAHVNRLASKYKTVIVLYYYQDMSYDEISKILNIPIGTVKSRMNTAKSKLHKQLLPIVKTEEVIWEEEKYVRH